MLVDPLLLSLTLAAPLLLSVFLRKDFLFMWVQFSANALFEAFMEDPAISNSTYFISATIINVVLGFVAWRLSRAYALVYFLCAGFTFLRAQELLSFSNGYFTIISNVVLCLILTTRFVSQNKRAVV